MSEEQTMETQETTTDESAVQADLPEEHLEFLNTEEETQETTEAGEQQQTEDTSGDEQVVADDDAGETTEDDQQQAEASEWETTKATAKALGVPIKGNKAQLQAAINAAIVDRVSGETKLNQLKQYAVQERGLPPQALAQFTSAEQLEQALSLLPPVKTDEQQASTTSEEQSTLADLLGDEGKWDAEVVKVFKALDSRISELQQHNAAMMQDRQAEAMYNYQQRFDAAINDIGRTDLVGEKGNESFDDVRFALWQKACALNPNEPLDALEGAFHAHFAKELTQGQKSELRDRVQKESGKRLQTGAISVATNREAKNADQILQEKYDEMTRG